MENPFTTIELQLSNINAKLDKVLAENNFEPDSELLTLQEYSKYIKKSLPTIWRYEKDGKIKPVIIAGKKYYQKLK